MSVKYWVNNLLSFKLPLRIFSILCIFVLGLITSILTYKSIIEALGFFKMEHLLVLTTIKIFSYTLGLLIGMAAMVQSAPIIWDRLGYWGQYIDNLLVYLLIKKRYFLDETEDLLQKTRKLINKANFFILKISWGQTAGQLPDSSGNLSVEIEALLKNNIPVAEHNLNIIIKLLKDHEVYDNINISRKHTADLSLYSLIGQLAEICRRLSKIKDELLV